MTMLGKKDTSLRLSGFVSVVLRAFLLAGKFVFMVGLARLTSPATVGIYALVVTITTISVFVIGGELHTYTTREVVKSDNAEEQRTHFQNHLRSVTTAAIFSLPLIWFVLAALKIDEKLSFLLLVAVLFGEVLCQELGRYLIIFSKPVASNFLQLVRSAAWMPFAVLVMKMSSLSAINVVLVCWAIGGWSAIIFGLWKLRVLVKSREIFTWDWLMVASGSARHYYVVAIFSQLQLYADRFIIQYDLGEKQVGMLAFYQSFANTTQAFVQTGVITILLPQLLVAVHKRSVVDTSGTYRKMLLMGVGVAAFVSVSMWFVMAPVLVFIKKEAYGQILDIFPWLLIGNVLLVAAQVPHLYLYALHKDKLLMWVSLAILTVSLVADLALIPVYGVKGAVGVFVVMALIQFMLKTKLSHTWRLRKEWAHAA